MKAGSELWEAPSETFLHLWVLSLELRGGGGGALGPARTMELMAVRWETVLLLNMQTH